MLDMNTRLVGRLLAAAVCLTVQGTVVADSEPATQTDIDDLARLSFEAPAPLLATGLSDAEREALAEFSPPEDRIDFGVSGDFGAMDVGLTFEFWVPKVDGVFGVLGTEASVHTNQSDAWSNLDTWQAKLGLETWHGNFGVLVDVSHLSMDEAAQTNVAVPVATTVDFTKSAIGLLLGFRIADIPLDDQPTLRGPAFRVDAAIGYRYTYAKQEIRGFGAGQRDEWSEFILAGRMQLVITPGLNLSGGAEITGLGATTTFTASAQLDVQLLPSLAFRAGYRYSTIDFTDDPFMKQDARYQGPMLGLTWLF